MTKAVIRKITLIIWLILIFGCNNEDSKIIEPPEDSDRRDDWNASWSAVHNIIAYIHDQDLDWSDPDSSGIYMINPDGSGKRLFYRKDLIIGLDWSHDGRWLAFNWEGKLLRISYPDGIVNELLGSGERYYPTYSPDDSLIATTWRSGDSIGIYLYEIQTNTNSILNQYADFPAWYYSDSILYLNNNSGLPLYAICLEYQDGSANRVFFEPSAIGAYKLKDFKCHIETNRIVCTVMFNYGSGYIYKFDPTNAVFEFVFEPGLYPNISPDGEQIVFTRWEGGDGKLWIINWDGTGLRQLTY